MTVVYLIRHSIPLLDDGIMNVSESDQIINEKIILSIEGEEKAKQISEISELQNIDVIWSSSYVRSKQTAKYIAYKNNLKINIDSRFNERKLGNIDKLKELGETKQHSFTEEQLLDKNLKIEFGESMNEVNERMSLAVSDILKKYEDKKIAIISHGAAMRFYLMNFCNLNDNIQLLFNNKVLDFSHLSIIKLTFNKNKIIDIRNINQNMK